MHPGFVHIVPKRDEGSKKKEFQKVKVPSRNRIRENNGLQLFCYGIEVVDDEK